MDDITLALFIGCELRPLAEADAPAVFRIADENRARLREWLSWVDRVSNEGDVLEFIRAGRSHSGRRQEFNFGLWLDADLAGVISLYDVDRAHRTARLGYWIARAFTGRRLATRATDALTAFAFGTLELQRLEIRCAVGNLNSQRVPQALGFTMEGTARGAIRLNDRPVDEYVYAKVSIDRGLHQFP